MRRLNKHLHNLEDDIVVRGDALRPTHPVTSCCTGDPNRKKAKHLKCLKSAIEKVICLGIVFFYDCFLQLMTQDQYYSLNVCGIRAGPTLASTFVSILLSIAFSAYGVVVQNNAAIH